MADGAEVPSSQPTISNAHARLQSLRNLLRSERYQGVDQQRALDAFDQEMSERSAEVRTGMEQRRRDLEAHLQDPDNTDNLERPPPSSSPSALVRSRRRAFRPSERLQRRGIATTTPATVRRGPDVDEIGTDSPRPRSTEAMTDGYLVDSPSNRDQRYRAKRRKLDDGTFDDETRVLTYGDKGRVTPGHLKMEIVTCDGGEYFEPPTGMAQHVLSDDNSVYSTKSNRCNMLLKHVGGQPFSLTKIVFKAPRDGYDAPVQEGMIFVSMNDDQLLEKTSQYDYRYLPKSYHQHHIPRQHDLYRPSQEYLHSSRTPLPPINRSRYLRDPHAYRPWSRHGESDPELETSQIPGFDVSFTDPSDTEEPPLHAPRSPFRNGEYHADYSLRSFADRYRPTYDEYVDLSASSDESEDDDTPEDHAEDGTEDPLDGSSFDVIAQNRRVFNQLFVSNDRPGSNRSNPGPETLPLGDGWRSHVAATNDAQDTSLRRRLRSRRTIHSRVTCPGSADSTFPNSAETNADVSFSRTASSSSSSTLAPHARFFIRRSKTAIAVNFDPPVAGRYLLIKLWSSCPNGNIDIQSIIAHGYGGPRFFPSCELR